jgi:hypothetical protein
MIEMGFLWERANRNLPALYGIYPDYFAPIVREVAESDEGSASPGGDFLR